MTSRQTWPYDGLLLVLNPFGEAFRRDGYRFPSQNGSVDGDAVKTNMIALGQEEYVKTFPDTVWLRTRSLTPSHSASWSTARCRSTQFDSDAKTAAGTTFTWSGIEAELHIFGAGAFNDTLTYMTQLTLADSGTFDIETAYLLWNDIMGPRHAFNLRGRSALRAADHELRAAQRLPGADTDPAGHLGRGRLYNGAGANAGTTFILGQGTLTAPN